MTIDIPIQLIQKLTLRVINELNFDKNNLLVISEQNLSKIEDTGGSSVFKDGFSIQRHTHESFSALGLRSPEEVINCLHNNRLGGVDAMDSSTMNWIAATGKKLRNFSHISKLNGVNNVFVIDDQSKLQPFSSPSVQSTLIMPTIPKIGAFDINTAKINTISITPDLASKIQLLMDALAIVAEINNGLPEDKVTQKS